VTLRSRLQRAIADEAFETAAALRDEIRGLE
jgi:protein-arginine kinase activator protein McsA